MEDPHSPPPRSILASLLLFEGGLAVAALVVGTLLHEPPLANARWTPLAAGQGLLATVPLILVLLAIERLPIRAIRELDAFARTSLVPLFRDLSLGEILLVSALAGLGEELLFRGVAQAWLIRSSGSVPFGLYVASLLFGLAHPISRTYVILAGVIGAYLGGLFLWTGNLVPAITAHAAYDFLAIVYLLRTSVADKEGAG